jgi:hypothetical protein
MASVTVLYPQGAKFDMDYYMAKHIPLVASKWTKDGLKGWKVLKFNDDAPYCVQATLEWGDMKVSTCVVRLVYVRMRCTEELTPLCMQEFQTAAGGPDTAEIMGDIKNFSDKEPVLMPGAVVGTS